MKKSSSDMVTINGELFKADVREALKNKMGLSMSQACTKILRKNDSFIVQSCAVGRFDKSSYETLCLMCGLNEDDYIVKQSPTITSVLSSFFPVE